jgi:catechol 2,3-dioxygenase-like lactoylglutathione lyase family enzyme
MTKLVHSMIRVLNEAESVQFYYDTFGLEVVDRLDFESFTLIYLALRQHSVSNTASANTVFNTAIQP